MNCPRCHTPLGPVTYEGEQVQVCPQCNGEWLSQDELEKIVQHHDKIFTPEELSSIQGVNKDILTAEADDHDELNCPACGAQMEHFNYGETSGVILHKCVTCHGLWMDKDQLETVEELVDGWKARAATDMEKWGPILTKIQLQEQAEDDKAVSISRFGVVNAILRRFCE